MKHKDLPAATGDDIVWADAVIFGTPTRFGSPQPIAQFIDSLGGLWPTASCPTRCTPATRLQHRARRAETTLLSL